MSDHRDEPAAGGGDVLERAQRLIEAFEAHPDPAVRADVTALLEAIDAVHRTGLTHLLGAIRGMAGDAFVNRLAADPAIRLLLMSYELLAVDRRLLADEALDAVRGHLHARGIDVELTDVIGGAVYVHLHGVEASGASAAAVRRDVEAALSAGLLGFQELVIGDRPSPRPPLIQVGGLRAPQRPVFRRACRADEAPPGTLVAVDIDGQPVLVANVAGELHAVADQCGDTPLPLRFGALDGAELACPWHGCRYDVRTGRRVDGGDGHLAILAVSVADGEVRVAVGVEPAVGP